MKIGDKVEVIDEALSGIVMEIDGEKITFETLDGFPVGYQKSELVLAEQNFDVDYDELQETREREERQLRKQKQVKSTKKDDSKPMEVDLHIHHLRNNVKNLSNFEMLNIQLDAARGQLEFAIKKRIQRVVFIHGKGKGVLRAELETMLSRYDNLKFYDANLQEYGIGATEVYIFQNT
jgi:DNA-nicking Smr family endonuclease